ncbi:Fc.00g090430.m01.CDS01 [Cosmosporella sp. VM-42]
MSVQPNGTNGNSPLNETKATEEVKEKPRFSWLQPHPIFVIILVGPDEHPFGIQKDFLCDQAEFFEKHFAETGTDEKLENIVKLPNTTKEIFGLAQNYLYTAEVISDVNNVPSYESLVGLWKLGYDLGIRGLCDKTLEAMIDCRRLTERIPATPLLIQVWKDTPEGSSIRTLLLSWAAEYMRSSDARAEFAKSLPQEVLSELVVAMSSFDTSPTVQISAVEPTPGASTTPRKNVHYLEEESEDEVLKNTKKNRRSSGFPSALSPVIKEPALSRKPSRSSLPKPPQKRRSSAAYIDGKLFTTTQKLDFCADLLTRMLSGPGFWTRLVGPFRDPVVPEDDGVPDYRDKVKRPMDLSTIKAKMDRKGYTDDEEFLADVRQIFDNCFTYWKKGDPMFAAGEKLQKTFEEKYSHMNKWISKMGGEEGE